MDLNLELDPKASSVWSGVPLWLLMLIQWILGLGATALLATVAALFWPVAAVYFHGLAHTNKAAQHVLAILAFLIGIILYGLFLTVFLIVGLVFWVVWIIQDINAVSAHTARPKLFNEYFRGLFTFAE